MRLNDIWKAFHATNNDRKRKHIPMKRRYMCKYYKQMADMIVDNYTRTIRYADTDTIAVNKLFIDEIYTGGFTHVNN